MSDAAREAILKVICHTGHTRLITTDTERLLDGLLKSIQRIAKESLPVIDSALAQQAAELADLRSRIAQLIAEGFDVNRVLEWQQSSPRKEAMHAFTAGPERQAAYLIEGEARKLREEREDARLLAISHDHWIRDLEGICITARGPKTIYNGPCDFDSDGLPILTDETRAALRAAMGE